MGRTMQVWRPCSQLPEHSVFDSTCGNSGIYSCTFSDDGLWIVSVGKRMCVWRVCCSPKSGRVSLRIYQKVDNVFGAKGLRAVTLGGKDRDAMLDTVVTGSRDGILCLWKRVTKAKRLESNSPSQKNSSQRCPRALPRMTS